MFTLQDKTALVTGASRGIGRATAAALAKLAKLGPGLTSWFTMAALRRKRNLSFPRSKRKAGAQRRSRRI